MSWPGTRFTTRVLKYGPEAIDSDSPLMILEAMVIASAKSALRLYSTSLIVFSCVRTLLRFGLSSMNPANCLETSETFCSR